jgi:membrane protease YdiL (CAAX protease family)
MSLVRRHPVISFFVLAYALTWAAIPWNSFFVPGVLISALVIVSVTEGKAGLKALGSRLIRWRVSWVWYVLAVGVPLLVYATSAALNTALGAPAASLVQLNPWYSLPVAIAINIISPMNAQLIEEPTFRGWAQPKLQATRTPLAATAWMAVGVTVWHIPFFLMPVFGSAPIEAVATIAVTFWYAWLFNHASGSSLLTLVAHATEGAIDTGALWAAEADTARHMGLYSVTWLAVAVVLLVANRRFWTRPPGPVDVHRPVPLRVGSGV